MNDCQFILLCINSCDKFKIMVIIYSNKIEDLFKKSANWKPNNLL